MAYKLSAKLRTDRPAAAGDKDCLIFNIPHNGIQIDFNRVTAEQIQNINAPDRIDVNFAIYHLVNARQNL